MLTLYTLESPRLLKIITSTFKYSINTIYRWVQTYRAWYTHIQLSTNIHSWVQTYTAGNKHVQLGTNIYRWVQICTAGYKHVQLGTNMYIWVQTYTAGYKHIQLGTNIYSWVQTCTSVTYTTHLFSICSSQNVRFASMVMVQHQLHRKRWTFMTLFCKV